MVDNTVANIWGDIGRTIYRLLDTVVYWVLGLMYQIFFNVASAELFTNETVKNFYGRVQLILGVFMIFKLAVSIVKGIVNPDTFVDKKEGMGNIIYRIMFSLVMLTIIAPINIPNASNEYEIQLNNNGLLFGTLYSLQNRILSNNTLGKLILGTNEGVTVQVGNNKADQTQKLKDAADLFTSTILKGFIRINLNPDANSQDETQKSNWMCKDDLDEETKQAYTGTQTANGIKAPDPEVVIGLTSLKCDAPDAGLGARIFKSNQRYMFAYRGFISAIVGGVFVYILLSFTIDIAVRAIKLAILRLLAPIPIIAYIDPSGEKQAFGSWTKLLTSTYLDLFIRLAIIYFVIFLVQDITVNGLVMNQATGVVGILTYIFIFLGLFIFAKQAPKFIKQVFGMKDDGGKLFGGFGQALGIGLGAAGAIGAGAAGWRAAKEENAALHPGSRLNFARNTGAALLNGITGGYKGVSAALGAKDQQASAALKALQQHNAQRTAHSTYGGRLADSAYGMLHGQSLTTKNQNILEANKKAADTLKKYKGMAVDESKKKGDYGILDAKKYGALGGIKFNYSKVSAAMQAKDTSGNFNYVDADGTSHTFNVSQFDSNVMAGIEDAQAARYIEQDYDSKTHKFKNGKLQDTWGYAKQALADTDITYSGEYMDYDTIGGSIGKANDAVRNQSTDMRNIMARANNQANKK